MTMQVINLGTYANDGTGDDLRTAFEKVQTNFIDIYNSLNDAHVGATPPTVDINEGELWWNTLDGRLYIKYGTAWIDASPNEPAVHYDISAVSTIGGANLQLNGTDSSADAVKIASGTNITVTRTDANTITLSSTSYVGNVTGNVTGNVIGNVTGNVTGNAGTVTNGVYTNGIYADPAWITSLAGSKIQGDISGKAGSVTNGVYTTSSINDLADVDTNTIQPVDGKALVWYASVNKWGPGDAATSINNLTDVDTSSLPPTNGQALVWNSSRTQWVPGTVATTGGGGGSLDFGTFSLPSGFTLDLGTF